MTLVPRPRPDNRAKGSKPRGMVGGSCGLCFRLPRRPRMRPFRCSPLRARGCPPRILHGNYVFDSRRSHRRGPLSRFRRGRTGLSVQDQFQEALGVMMSKTKVAVATGPRWVHLLVALAPVLLAAPAGAQLQEALGAQVQVDKDGAATQRE